MYNVLSIMGRGTRFCAPTFALWILWLIVLGFALTCRINYNEITLLLAKIIEYARRKYGSK